MFRVNRCTSLFLLKIGDKIERTQIPGKQKDDDGRATLARMSFESKNGLVVFNNDNPVE